MVIERVLLRKFRHGLPQADYIVSQIRDRILGRHICGIRRNGRENLIKEKIGGHH